VRSKTKTHKAKMTARRALIGLGCVKKMSVEYIRVGTPEKGSDRVQVVNVYWLLNKITHITSIQVSSVLARASSAIMHAS